jgi:hypothetical protein
MAAITKRIGDKYNLLEYKLKVLLWLFVEHKEIKSILKKWDFLGVKQDAA